MLTALFNSRSARQIAKFAARVPSFPRRPIRKSTRRTFCSRRLPYPQICEPNLRQSALSHSIPLCTFALFSRFFCISPHLSSTFFRARPAFEFCRFARSIRSGYEQTCTQTPNFRALFTRRCARILSKFYAEFQDCLHLNLRRRHKRLFLRARTKYLHDTAQEMKFRRRLSKRVLAAAVRREISKRQQAAIKFIRGSAL